MLTDSDWFMRRGVTGFWHTDDDALPQISEAQYVEWLRGMRFACRPTPAGIAQLASNHYWMPHVERSLVALAHHHLPIVATIEKPDSELSLEWTFVDELVEIDGGPIVVSAAVAARPFESASAAKLPKVEQDQIAYWSPPTLGALLFNRWD